MFQVLPNLELKITSYFGTFEVADSDESERVLSFSGDTYSVSNKLKELRRVLRNTLSICSLTNWLIKF